MNQVPFRKVINKLKNRIREIEKQNSLLREGSNLQAVRDIEKEVKQLTKENEKLKESIQYLKKSNQVLKSEKKELNRILSELEKSK
jgi:predicted  nucleic acid-binding Zn-ribbon protein